MSDLTPETIAHLRELDAARTQGELMVVPIHPRSASNPDFDYCCAEVHAPDGWLFTTNSTDAEFIAAAANHMDALLDAAEERDQLHAAWEVHDTDCAAAEAEVSRLRAELAEAQARIERVTALRARLDLVPHPQEPHVVIDIAEALDAALAPATQREEGE